MRNPENHQPSNNSEIEQHAHEIYAACRANVKKYTSGTGIKLRVGDVDWAVVYWEESPTSEELLAIVRGWRTHENTVAYEIYQSGEITKNFPTDVRDNSAIFKPENKTFVDDEHEAATLLAIVQAAHLLKTS